MLIFVPTTFPVIDFLITGNLKMIANFWFPFDIFTPRNFFSVLLWIDFCAWTHTTYMLGVDSLLFALISLLTMEYDILRADFVDLKLTPAVDRTKKLKSLVERHNTLFGISEKLQRIYEAFFLASFVSSSLTLCYAAFMMSYSSDSQVFVMNGCLVIMTICPVLLLCYFSQKASDSSFAIADEIYDCEWEEFEDNRFVKQLILVFVRAQKPIQLSAMGFFTMNLESFTTVSNFNLKHWKSRQAFSPTDHCINLLVFLALEKSLHGSLDFIKFQNANCIT